MSWFDPYCLRPPPGPVPVDGETAPVLHVVEDDDLEPREHPRWVRAVAWGLAAFFVVAMVTTTAATHGQVSLLTDAGLPIVFGLAVQQPAQQAAPTP